MEFTIKSSRNYYKSLVIDLCFYQDLDTHETVLSEILNEYRNKIDLIDPLKWKVNRKKYNKYDFDVNSIIINRAFYKLWEIMYKYDIWNNLKVPDILHIAEAPGGFIQCSLHYSSHYLHKKPLPTKEIVDSDGFKSVLKKVKNTHKKPNIHTMSLLKGNSISNYSKHILGKNVTVLKGLDNTGDICNLDNIDDIYQKYNIKYDYITADGGFDEGSQFNNKEQLHYRLICSEIYTGITLNKIGGHFILKMFDLHTDSSIHLLYLLSLFYKEMFIYKPLTSRPTNSEKYIICKGYQESLFLEKSINILHEINKNIEFRFFKIFKEIPIQFLNDINDINKKFLNDQIYSLKQYIELCSNNNKNQIDKEKTFAEWSLKFRFSF